MASMTCASSKGPKIARRRHDGGVITCVVEYVVDPAKIEAFERFARRWMELVDRHGGQHHGYFLPSEGASDKALALLSFPQLRGVRALPRPVRRGPRLRGRRPDPRRERLRPALRAHLHAAAAARLTRPAPEILDACTPGRGYRRPRSRGSPRDGGATRPGGWSGASRWSSRRARRRRRAAAWSPRSAGSPRHGR